MKKRCAVCGDTCATNVKLAWRRDVDGKMVNVCMMCAESGKVNAQSIDNYTDKETIYVPTDESKIHERKSTLARYYVKNSLLGNTSRTRTKSSAN